MPCREYSCPNKTIVARGWCSTHYQRWLRVGSPLPIPPASHVELLWQKISRNPDTGCWDWLGATNPRGYGRIFRAKTKGAFAHRAVYELIVEPIPVGLELDHLCRNPGCVNPAHLEPVSHRENVLRGQSFVAFNARKTRCPNGHPYDKRVGYSRRCSRCDAKRLREWHARQRFIREQT